MTRTTTSSPNRSTLTPMSHITQHFTAEHLPDDLAAVSKPFCDLAHAFDQLLPDSAEKTAALRKLLEAKDCAVRAALEARPRT